ncbi:MAG TPA: helicase-related protein [Thermoanaerobaculia bacterium]|nr:helicase-related protein [Thermoanaerobaculia bacterium]
MAPPWNPVQQVRIGVLRPVEADEARGAVDGSRIGIDFVARSTEGIELLDLEIDVSFALYQPLWPTRLEVLEAARREGDEEAGVGSTGAAQGRHDLRLPITEAWQRSNVFATGLRLGVPVNGTHAGPELANALDAAVRDAVSVHFGRSDAARPFASPGRTVPLSALNTDERYAEALRARVDGAWMPQIPAARLHAFVEEMPNGNLLVSVSLVNQTQPREGDRLQDLNLYDARIEARVVAGGHLEPQRFHLAPDDYRQEDLAEIIGHGRGCVAISAADDGVATETLPLHIQRVVRHRTEHLPELSWSKLDDDPFPILSQVEDAMRAYLREWDAFLPGLGPEARLASERDRNDFDAETRRFAGGRALLGDDAELLRAFRLANRVFARAGAARGHTSWRPFQLVYLIEHLAAVAARRHRHRADLLEELKSVDVLWFPTGGGKTEAYLGLIVVALFYDRFRGKDRGTTALLRFPLRMLSAQQLDRVLRVLTVADDVRHAERIAGAPFELGYLVGGGNTPNALRYEQGWWPGMANAERLTESDRRRHRLIAGCPFCGAKDAVRLAADAIRYRLLHKCTACNAELPLHVSDDEVYRYQPAVIVSTVDKVVGLAHFGEFTSFAHGPAGRCPDHGYFVFGGCGAEGCTRAVRELERVTGWHDPVPTLVIQDELHLVAEELGVFAAHFESLLAEIQCAGPSGLPPKILAASATIEGFDDQVRQVYGRRPRRFPSPGFERRWSFYTLETPDVRRAFLGVMPTGGGTSRVEIAGRIQVELVRAVQDLEDDPSPLRIDAEAALGRVPLDDELRTLLFDYEVSLGYVNRRADGARMSDDLRSLDRQLEAESQDGLRHELLTGDVPITELASAIAQIEHARPTDLRRERLRALVGTSVLSHGVDLERLNLMTMTGMPATIADYIQSTSRAGRAHAGLVVTVFDHFALREASTFSHFLSTHLFLDRLVEQVPVNKYARLAIDRTLSTIVMALLWDLARDPLLRAPSNGIRYTRDFRPWWISGAADIQPRLAERLRRALRSAVPEVADSGLEARLVRWGEERWERHELPSLQSFRSRLVKDCFAMRVLTSLRDVDEPATFGADSRHGPAFEALR